jgi:hypothetical protein
MAEHEVIGQGGIIISWEALVHVAMCGLVKPSYMERNK